MLSVNNASEAHITCWIKTQVFAVRIINKNCVRPRMRKVNVVCHDHVGSAILDHSQARQEIVGPSTKATWLWKWSLAARNNLGELWRWEITKIISSMKDMLPFYITALWVIKAYLALFYLQNGQEKHTPVFAGCCSENMFSRIRAEDYCWHFPLVDPPGCQ